MIKWIRTLGQLGHGGAVDPSGGVNLAGLQGYLTHKKTPTPLCGGAVDPRGGRALGAVLVPA